MKKLYKIWDGVSVREERLTEEDARYYACHGYTVELIDDERKY